MKEEKNLILKLTFTFSLNIIKFSKKLESKKQFVFADQLFRSGTSIGANVWEAQSAESKADFIHKLKIADKESHETEYWLMLCQEIQEDHEINKLIEQLTSIKKVLGKIIASTKKNTVKTNA
jgi:four helix bundle protein